MIIFASVRFLSKKVTKPKLFFFKKKTETGSNRPVSVRFSCLGQKPVQTGLARFSRVWLGFFQFFVGFGSIRFFFYKTEPAGFFKNLIGFFGFFFRFSRFNWFSGFFFTLTHSQPESWLLIFKFYLLNFIYLCPYLSNSSEVIIPSDDCTGDEELNERRQNDMIDSI